MRQQFIDDFRQLEDCYFQKAVKEDAVKLLKGGFSYARNYRVEDGEKTYLVRFMPTEQSLASREKECFMTDYANKIGIGPKVYYQDPKQGILITEFIKGRMANYDDIMGDPNRCLIIAKLKKLHQTAELSAFTRARAMADQIQATLYDVGSVVLQQQLQALDLITPLNKLFRYEENNTAAMLIHGDFNPNNLLVNENRVYFIDWTNAGVGDPFIDISWLAFCLPVTRHRELLSYYFDQVDATMEKKLCCYHCLRVFLHAAWGVKNAQKVSQDSEQLLITAMEQKNLSEPSSLAKDVLLNKMSFDSVNDFLLFTATDLHFLARFTKTDTFLSAVEELSHHA